jgi:hypothetical protein
MRISASLLVAIALGAIGCTDAPKLREESLSISGRVLRGGKPVGNIVVSFHPLDSGHLKSLPVNTDGTFDGELIGGNYSYYVGQSLAANSLAALKRIDPKYYQPDLERNINVEFGKEIVLALD